MFGVDFPIHERVGRIQAVVLNELLNGDTLNRVQNIALKAENGDMPLTLAEIFRTLTDAIWADLPNGDKASIAKSSIIRRNLQREYLKDLSNIVLRGRVPADARSLARMHLRDAAKRIDLALKDKELSKDDTLRAHLEESKEQIAKVLNAGIQASQP